MQTGCPKLLLKASTKAPFSAPPPVITTCGSTPTRPAIPVIRVAMDAMAPAATLAWDTPAERWEMTSDSANTVQRLLMGTTSSPCWASWEREAMGQSSTRAITSKKRPVPAAHLSFMTKFSTLPSCPRRMTLVSCPPTSTMVRAEEER